MKLKILILLVAVLLCGSLSALDIYAGGKIGPGVAFVYGDDTDDYDPMAGMSLGVYGMFAPIKYFAVQAEFNYEMKGYSGEIGNNLGAVEGRQWLHYLSVPLIAKAVIPVKILVVQPYMGFNFSFLVNANYKYEANSIIGNLIREDDNKDGFEIFDMGVLLGGELFFNITKQFFISTDLRFELNFLRIDEDRNTDKYNGAFYALFGAGYKF